MIQTSYETEIEADTVVVGFREISRFYCDGLGQELQAELGRDEFARCKHILVDCEHLNYANSQFVEVLLRLSRVCEEKQGRFALCCLQDFLQQVFQVTRLESRWPVYASRDAALAELNAS